MDICRLCGKETELCNSHIIPKFIFDYIKNMSITGGIRMTTNPNRRLEDGLKIKFLCKDCEEKFSKYEKYFKENVFNKIIDKNDFTVDTNDNNIRFFILSISWRVLKYTYETDKEMFDDLTDYEKSIIENKLSFWKTILYNENHKLISKEKSYFIPLKTDTILGKTNGNNVAIDFKIFGDKNKFETEYAITYVKIPFIIISTEVWGIRKRFRKYRVGHHIKSISYNKLPIEVKTIIDNQQRSFYESMKDISPIQIQKIKERAIKSIKDDN